MAEFTRKELKKIFEAAELDVPKDVLGQICDLHTSSNEDLTDTVKNLRSDLEKTEQERDAFKAKAPKDGEATVLKSEFDKLQEDFDSYKNEVKNKESKAAKEAAIKELYKSIGISEKRIDTILKVTNLEELELDKDGKIKNAESRKEAAKTEWADFIETETTRGAPTVTPPANVGGTAKTKEEILAIKDGALRRQEIAKNPKLFGLE